MKNWKKFSLGALLCFAYIISASGQIGINTESPKSTLDVSATVDANHIAGIQAPRLTLAELTAKGNILYGANQNGAIIYVTDVTGGGNTGQRVNITTSGYYYFDGTNWQKLGVLEATDDVIGDVKYSFTPSDHNGWFMLDGRAVSSLPANVRVAANSLGFTTNIPNTSDRMLKTKTGSEILGSTGGANSLSITQANLPSAVSLSGTITAGTSANGGAAHTHTFSGTSANGGAAHIHTFSGTSNIAGRHDHDFTRPTQSATSSHRGVIQLSSAYSVDNDENFTSSSAGAHTHTFSGTSKNGGAHTHTFSGSASGGAHTHTLSGAVTVNLGGSGTALNNRPAYLNVNTFVYLGK